MPNENQVSFARMKVLFNAMLTAGGVLAPTLTLADPSVETALCAGLLSLGASWRVNQATEEASDRERAQLPETAALLRNHDLNLLTGAAIQRAIEHFANQNPASDSATLNRLATAAPAYLVDIAERAEPIPSLDDLPNVAVHLAQFTASPNLPSLGASIWEDFLQELASHLQPTPDATVLRPALALHLNQYFDRFVVEVFKEDATGRGPAQGRGWPALTLLFWGRLFTDVQRLEATAATRDANMQLQLHTLSDSLGKKLDELLRWHGPLAATQAEPLADFLRQVHAPLNARLDDIAGLIGHGLLSPDEFRTAYWTKRRADPGLEVLWLDPDRSELLTSVLAGRDTELDEFSAFLAAPTPWVTFFKGFPGTGKSRLLLEFARRATGSGYQVYFVSPDVHDLKAALLSRRMDDPVVLLWDDYQGQKPEALKTFLDLQTLSLHGPVVKRVITSWPSHNVLGEKAKDPLYATRELHPVVPESALAAYSAQLLPELSNGAALKLVRRAEGHPEAVLQAVALLLNGEAKSVDQLPPNLLATAHDNLIERIKRPPNGITPQAVTLALKVLALVGEIDYSRPTHAAALTQAGVTDEAIGYMDEIGLAAHVGEKYALTLDGFRSHVVRRCLDRQAARVLSGDPDQLAALAGPLLPVWFDAIWGICLLATEGTPHRDRVQSSLLLQLRDRIGQLPTLIDPLEFASGILWATSIEPLPLRRSRLADAIGLLLNQFPSYGIALQQAGALVNATIAEPDRHRRAQLAGDIGLLLNKFPSHQIAHLQATALCNATVGEPESYRCSELADAIGLLLTQFPSYDIALENAKALLNATVGKLEPHRRPQLAGAIGLLLNQFPSQDIAIQQAKALCNATAGEPEPHRRAQLAGAIGLLLNQFPSQEIALEQAKALLNATVNEPEPHRRVQLADAIDLLLNQFPYQDIALLRAEALLNATVGEPESHRITQLADAIGLLLNQFPSHDIALRKAQALYNATVVEPDPHRGSQLADAIGLLLNQFPSPDIALQQAKALFNATVNEPEPHRFTQLADTIGLLLNQFPSKDIAHLRATAMCNATVSEPEPHRCSELADAIGLLLNQFPSPDIALQQARALRNATVGEPDPHRCSELADAIGLLLNQFPSQYIAVEQAKALLNITVREAEPHRRAQLAGAIGLLLSRFPSQDIALQQAKALRNATVGEPDPRRRAELAEAIGLLLNQFPSQDIALQQAKALFNATVDEPDPHRCSQLADAIGFLLNRFPSQDIALRQARALCNAAEGEPDPHRRSQLADAIGLLLNQFPCQEIQKLHHAATSD